MPDNTLKINTIPSPTWNWLKMNETEIEKKEVCPGGQKYNESVPDGIVRVSESPDFGSDIKGGAGEVFDAKIKETTEETVFFSCGNGQVIDQPVVIAAEYGGESVGGRRVVIEAQEGSRSTFLTDFSGNAGTGRACFQTLIRVKKGAELTLVQTERLGSSFELINDIGAVLEEDARLNIVHVFLGGGSIYQGCNIKLSGDRSAVKKDIGYFLKGSQELDMNYVVVHEGKKTECDIKTSGVMEGESSKLFRGTIDFKNGCAGSRGAEIEEVILMDDGVHNKTIPVILCAEEDVEGHHGASIGRLDEDLIFYMKSRGLREDEIYDLISKARLHSFCSKIPDEDIRAKTMTFER